MFRSIRRFFPLFGVFILLATGCSSLSTNSPAGTPNVNRREVVPVTNSTHIVVVKQRRGVPPVHWYSKLNPVWWFGNVDDPLPPDDFQPGEKGRTLHWYLRNPMHNFFFYVIGVSDRTTVRSGCYPERVFNPEGRWNFAVTRWGLLLLPFVSYQGDHVEWYFGWRISGNLGMAARGTGKE